LTFSKLVVSSAVLLCNFRCWWQFKCCFCGKNSSLWQSCWIFSRQHDTAACKLDRYGLSTLMQHCVWTHRQLAVESQTFTHCVLLVVCLWCYTHWQLILHCLPFYTQSSDVAELLKVTCNWALLYDRLSSCGFYCI